MLCLHRSLFLLALACPALTLTVGAPATPDPAQAAPPAQRPPVEGPRIQNGVDVDPDLVPISQRIINNTGLITDLRVTQPGLDLPSGFDRLYRVAGHDDFFVRTNGALYAVFDRTNYVQTEEGPMSVVPAGTVYHIGGLPVALTGGSTAPRRLQPMANGTGEIVAQALESQRIEADPNIEDETTASRWRSPVPPGAEPETLPRFVDDPVYRRQRILLLMQAATNANQAARGLSSSSSK